MEHAVLQAISQGRHHNPHSFLGIHLTDSGFVIRTLRPFANKVSAKLESEEIELTHLFDGIWESAPLQKSQSYRITASYPDSNWLSDDGYRHLSTVGELDLHLFSEGRHEQLWQALGAHEIVMSDALGDVSGVSFKLWAPNAAAVRVIGNFNQWDGRISSMRSLGSSGVWELFVPDATSGDLYRFQILTQDGNWLTKSDPMASSTEVSPANASRVFTSQYSWSDQDWLTKRMRSNPLVEPMSVYELHLGSWGNNQNYRDIAPELVGYIQKLGFTHVEFLPLAEHPFGGSWGYQVTGYYAATSRFGSPDDFRFLVDSLHQANIGVIMDWVPAHFPKDDWALAQFDGRALYEHQDPRKGEHPDWGTLIFNYGRNEVKNFLMANALFWIEQFHIDGLRVDAVASMLYLDYSRKDDDWIPNEYGGRENLEAIEFLKEVNATAYRRNPGIAMIAEESTAFAGVTATTEQGGLGFGFKWNMGWMHDSLEYIQKDPMHRSHHHGQLTFSMLYAYDENFILPISHDEVVHGKGSLLQKMPGDHWQKLANMRAYLAFMWSHPGKKVLFMGQEFAQPSEWGESRELDRWVLEQPAHLGMQKLTARLNELYLEYPALWELDHQPAGFEWIDSGNTQQNVISFLRKDSGGNQILMVINFAGHPYEGFRLGAPKGSYREILNTDDLAFGGSGVTNPMIIRSSTQAMHSRPDSVVIQLPPLGASWLILEK